MTKTLEERQKTARTNGAKSRGPTTTRGKAISSRNGVKLGIYAKTITLPDEDPALIPALRLPENRRQRAGSRGALPLRALERRLPGGALPGDGRADAPPREPARDAASAGRRRLLSRRGGGLPGGAAAGDRPADRVSAR